MRGVLFSLLVSFSSTLSSQTLLVDDFSHPAGDALTLYGWTAHGSAGTNPILVHSAGLTYAGHPGSGTGNAVRLFGTGEDVHRSFATQSNTTVYVSFLISVQDASTGTSEKHFLHLNTSSHVGRVSVVRSSGSIAFGLERGSEGPIFTGTTYSLNTVYLVVLRYDHVSGSDNDAASLYVFENGVPTVEPAVPTLGPVTTTGTEPSGISAVALRQADSPSNDFLIDAIRIGTSWTEAGLPVQLSRFEATAGKGVVELRWRTESETGNYGFDVERRRMEGGGWMMDDGGWVMDDARTNRRHYSPFTIHDSRQWQVIGFVPGSGTSSSPREYAFTDTPDQPGRYAYRLKQIDLDGTTTRSGEVIVDVAGDDDAVVVSCYPNPFNGIMNVLVQVPQEGRVVLKVHDVLGREVATLLDERKVPGTYRVLWPAEGVSSGVYYYRGEVGGKRIAGRMVFMK